MSEKEEIKELELAYDEVDSENLALKKQVEELEIDLELHKAIRGGQALMIRKLHEEHKSLLQQNQELFNLAYPDVEKIKAEISD